jgi:hypothetical protein
MLRRILRDAEGLFEKGRVEGELTMKTGKKDLQGEGNYDAARDYNRGAHEHAKDKDAIQREAKTARDALEGKEGEELEQAETKGRKPARH